MFGLLFMPFLLHNTQPGAFAVMPPHAHHPNANQPLQVQQVQHVHANQPPAQGALANAAVFAAGIGNPPRYEDALCGAVAAGAFVAVAVLQDPAAAVQPEHASDDDDDNVCDDVPVRRDKKDYSQCWEDFCKVMKRDPSIVKFQAGFGTANPDQGCAVALGFEGINDYADCNDALVSLKQNPQTANDHRYPIGCLHLTREGEKIYVFNYGDLVDGVKADVVLEGSALVHFWCHTRPKPIVKPKNGDEVKSIGQVAYYLFYEGGKVDVSKREVQAILCASNTGLLKTVEELNDFYGNHGVLGMATGSSTLKNDFMMNWAAVNVGPGEGFRTLFPNVKRTVTLTPSICEGARKYETNELTELFSLPNRNRSPVVAVYMLESGDDYWDAKVGIFECATEQCRHRVYNSYCVDVISIDNGASAVRNSPQSFLSATRTKPRISLLYISQSCAGCPNGRTVCVCSLEELFRVVFADRPELQMQGWEWTTAGNHMTGDSRCAISGLVGVTRASGKIDEGWCAYAVSMMAVYFDPTRYKTLLSELGRPTPKIPAATWKSQRCRQLLDGNPASNPSITLMNEMGFGRICYKKEIIQDGHQLPVWLAKLNAYIAWARSRPKEDLKPYVRGRGTPALFSRLPKRFLIPPGYDPIWVPASLPTPCIREITELDLTTRFRTCTTNDAADNAKSKTHDTLNGRTTDFQCDVRGFFDDFFDCTKWKGKGVVWKLNKLREFAPEIHDEVIDAMVVTAKHNIFRKIHLNDENKKRKDAKKKRGKGAKAVAKPKPEAKAAPKKKPAKKKAAPEKKKDVTSESEDSDFEPNRK